FACRPAASSGCVACGRLVWPVESWLAVAREVSGSRLAKSYNECFSVGPRLFRLLRRRTILCTTRYIRSRTPTGASLRRPASTPILLATFRKPDYGRSCNSWTRTPPQHPDAVGERRGKPAGK